MLPSNVMSFMKKMVAQEEITPQSDNTGAFGKLKQTLSSSLLTAQDKVNKMSPRPSLIPDLVDNSPAQSNNTDILEKDNESSSNISSEKNEGKTTTNRAGSCRVCLKSFKAEDFSKTCFECKYRVCEDCASYSKIDSSEDLNTWRCSVCRRKMSSRVCIPQDSTDSNLDVPVLEALQRRHSDVKLNASNSQAGLMAPPRSPDLRRHSDVSPASFRELEKFTSNTKTNSSNNNINNNDTDWDLIRTMVPDRIEIEPPTRMNSRRQSRVSRQHSYDDDIQKNAISNSLVTEDLCLPVAGQIPRRKSAYDVFGGVQPNQQQILLQSAEPDKPPSSRRSSFRIPVDDDQDDSPNSDNGPTLLIDDDRRIRRRGSQLPDISALRERGILGINPQGTTLSVNPVNPYQGPALEDLEAPKKQTSLDGEAIKIVIHDFDSGPLCASKRRVVLRRDPSDKAHRTRGFGMRVVGGKTGTDGRLFAYIVWTVPGGEAEKGGLRQGDKILEWCNVSLVDRSFEEVCSIMDRTGDVAELLVEHASDFRMCDLLEDNPLQSNPAPAPNINVRKNSEMVTLVAETENNDKSPASPTRRKLPKTPEQAIKEKQVSGRIQVQVWYHDDRNELVVNLLAADDLALRDEAMGFGKLPEAYAKVNFAPKSGDGHVAQTEVCMPNHSPIWNATLMFDIGNGSNLIDSNIEISLWDLIPQNDSLFLGECSVDLKNALLNDRAIWYRLEDPKNLRAQSLSKCQYFNPSPRNSAVSIVTGFIRRNDYSIQRSVSDDCESIGDGASLLHPDHAWFQGSRRGSSQSETLEIESYQLNKDFSKSLPGSRRSSFQDQEKRMMEGVTTPPSCIARRRSSCVRKDPDEVLKSLKAVRGELGRTMSLCRETEYNNNKFIRRSSRISYDTTFEDNWRGSIGNFHNQNQDLKLGPGQRKPKNFVMNSPKYGELFLEFHTTKSFLEIRILGTKSISFYSPDNPDTFVECYIKDNNEKVRQRKKTDTVRNSLCPTFNNIVKYAMSDIYRRSIVFILWQTNIDYERNIGIGAIEIFFGNFKFDQIYSGFYPLFPLFSLGLDPNYSP